MQTRLIADDGRDVSNIPDTIGEIQVKTSSLIQEYETVKLASHETSLTLIVDTGGSQVP